MQTMELSTLLVLGGLGAVLALFAFCEVQDRKREAASAKARKKREIDLLVAYCMLMEEHEATLKLRVRQATYHDPYGRPVLDKAFKELSYFFDEVLVREIAPAGERDYEFLKTTFDRWVRQLEVEPSPAPIAAGPNDGREYE